MSAISLSWVATIQVGNQTAKQLLQFYASHNFANPWFEFKNSTLARQLEVDERTIRNAHKLLLEKNLIIKEARFNDQGRQIPNQFWLNIPQSFVDKFMGEGDSKSALGRNVDPGGEERRSALINNNINNKLNNKKLSCPSDDEPSLLFLEFWSIYPRKDKRKETLTLWKKKKFDEIAPILINDVKKRLPEWASREKKHIPMATTYLNGDRWTDEINEPPIDKRKKLGLTVTEAINFSLGRSLN